MLRKLFVAAALVLASAAVTSTPAPAIDYVCSCSLCQSQTGLGCRDLDGRHIMWTSCRDYYPTHCR